MLTDQTKINLINEINSFLILLDQYIDEGSKNAQYYPIWYLIYAAYLKFEAGSFPIGYKTIQDISTEDSYFTPSSVLAGTFKEFLVKFLDVIHKTPITHPEFNELINSYALINLIWTYNRIYASK